MLIRSLIPLFCLTALLPQAELLALDDLTTGEAPTVYFQWLSSPSDPMTAAQGDGTVNLAPYIGGSLTQLTSPASQDLYLGVMCNRAGGYDVFFTGTTPGPASNQCRLTLPGASDLVVTLTLNEVGGTFDGGATTSISEDLSGGTASAGASFPSDSDAPLQAALPNVWRVTLDMPSLTSVSDGLITAGSYSGNLTADVQLK